MSFRRGHLGGWLLPKVENDVPTLWRCELVISGTPLLASSVAIAAGLLRPLDARREGVAPRYACVCGQVWASTTLMFAFTARIIRFWRDHVFILLNDEKQ